MVTVFAGIERFLGFVYRIVLSRTLGGEGMGVYQIALSVFGVLVTLSASGIPVTVSRLISKCRAEGKIEKAHNIATAGMIMGLIISVSIVSVFYIFKDKLSFLFTDKEVMPIFYVMLPGLILTTNYAVIRGVFWGNKDFPAYSIIELIEEFAMILIGIILVTNVTSVYQGAKRIALAMTLSYVLSFTLSLIVYFFKKGKLASPKGQFRSIFSSSMPITSMRTTSSLLSSAIAVLLPLNLVKAGLTRKNALSKFGIATGMALPILNIPATIISSLALVIVPELSESYYKNNHKSLKSTTEKVLKFSVLFTLLIIPVFAILGEEMGVILYSSREAGKFISLSSLIMLPMCLTLISNSILNSLGEEKRTFIHFLIGGALLLISIIVLPNFCGIYSLSLGYGLCYLSSTILNLNLLNKKSKLKPQYKKFTISCVILSIPSIIIGKLLKNVLLTFIGLVPTFIICGILQMVISLLLLLVFNVIDFDFLKIKKSKKAYA